MADDELVGDEAQQALADGFNDQQRQQRRQSGVNKEQEEKDQKSPGNKKSTSSLKSLSGQMFTAAAWKFCWRFYLPTFTLSGLYLLIHVLARYLLQWKVFCPAQDPFFGDLGKAASLVGGGKAGTNLSRSLAASKSSTELVWVIAAVMAGLLPLIIIFFIYVIISTISFAVAHPGKTFTCTVSSLWKSLTFSKDPMGDSGFLDKVFNCLLSGGSGGGTLAQ